MKSNPLSELKDMKGEIALKQCNDAKVVLMLAVVVCHCFAFWEGWFTNNPAIPSPAARFIAEWLGSFHVFAFTVISGYLFYYLQMEKQHYPSFARFICKKNPSAPHTLLGGGAIMGVPSDVFIYSIQL